VRLLSEMRWWGRRSLAAWMSDPASAASPRACSAQNALRDALGGRHRLVAGCGYRLSGQRGACRRTEQRDGSPVNVKIQCANCPRSRWPYRAPFLREIIRVHLYCDDLGPASPGDGPAPAGCGHRALVDHLLRRRSTSISTADVLGGSIVDRRSSIGPRRRRRKNRLGSGS